MKKRSKKPVNIRPKTDVCLKCENNGICQAQNGLVDYHCPKNEFIKPMSGIMRTKYRIRKNVRIDKLVGRKEDGLSIIYLK